MIIEGTKNTPRIEILPQSLIITGRSIMEDTLTFYSPILKEIEKISCNDLVIEIKIEYMNTSSSKQLITIFKSIAQNHNIQKVYVKWFYEHDDEDMREMGEDLESLTHLPFDFYEYEEQL